MISYTLADSTLSQFHAVNLWLSTIDTGMMFNNSSMTPDLYETYEGVCNNNLLHLYSTFTNAVGAQSALHCKGETHLSHHQCLAPTWVIQSNRFLPVLTTHQLAYLLSVTVCITVCLQERSAGFWRTMERA